MRKGVLLCLFILLFSGCSKSMQNYYKMTDAVFEPSNYFVHPEYDRFKIRRVMFAPIKNETTYSDVQRVLEPIFMTEWSKINYFEIVPAYGDVRNEFDSFHIHERGRFYKLRLYDIAKRFNVDAVIFTHVTRYSPYEPCTIGINVQMIHTYSGVVVWALNETYDGKLREVENMVRNYYFENMRFEYPLLDWKIMMVSMRNFAQAVGYSVANSLTDYIVPPRINEAVINAATLSD